MELSPPVPARWLYRLPLTGTTPALTWPDTVDSASLVASPSSDGDSRFITTTWTIGRQHFGAGVPKSALVADPENNAPTYIL